MQHGNQGEIRKIFEIKTNPLSNAIKFTFFRLCSEMPEVPRSSQSLLSRLQALWVQEKIKELCFAEFEIEKLDKQIMSISSLLHKLNLSVETLECFFTKLILVRNRNRQKKSDFNLNEIEKLLTHILERAIVSSAVFTSLLLNQEFDSLATLHRFIDLLTLQEQLRKKNFIFANVYSFRGKLLL